MDIARWLDETAAAAAPRYPEVDTHSPEPARLISTGAAFPAARPYTKAAWRRKGQADSSILAPESIVPKRSSPPLPASDHRRGVEPKRRRLSTDEHSSGSPAGYRPASPEADEPYTRRKRHKTRDDKYEPKSKDARRNGQSGIHGKKREDNKSDGKKKKKAAKGKPNDKLLRNFRADNVARDRVTLQPTASNLGLFNKGRAGSPFRGQGLPDLVFSEMNFLQQRKTPRQAALPAEAIETRRKKDRARQAEEEISAYFAPTRSALADRDPNVPDRRSPVTLAHKAQRQVEDKRPHKHHDRFVSQVSQARSLSGRLDSARRSKSATETYFSWSTSVKPGPDPKVSQPGSKSLANDAAASSSRTQQQASIPRRRQTTDAVLQRNQQYDSAGKRRHQNEGKKHRHEEAFDAPGKSMKTQAAVRPVRANKRPHKSMTAAVMGSKGLSAQTTDSLPLPSSPPLPRHRSIHLEGSDDVADNHRETTEAHISRIGGVSKARSTSPLAKLLRDCDAVSLEARSARLEEEQYTDMVGLEAYDLEAFEDEAADVWHPDNRSAKDLRRTWRRVGEPVNRYAIEHEQQRSRIDAVQYEQGDPAHAFSPELLIPAQSELQYFNEDSEEVEEIDEYENEGEIELETEMDQMTYDGNKEIVAPDDTDEMNDFGFKWKPNILY